MFIISFILREFGEVSDIESLGPYVKTHWKATMEYHKTKDILHVKQLLGHKKIDNTLMYTQLIAYDNEDDFSCRTAKTIKEAKELIESGFEYVTQIEDTRLFRKRK